MFSTYRLILSLHVIAVISWMAGILYLYRLLIYGAERAAGNPAIHELLALMARRLSRYITIPAMVVSWLAGLTMIAMNSALMQQGWFHAKLLCVILLTAATIYAARLTSRFQNSTSVLPTSRRLRILNEIPTLLMIIIVVMVILRPF